MKINRNNGSGLNMDELKKAAQSGNVDDYINKNLSPDAASKLQRILADKNATEKLMSTPQAQELLKKLTGEK